MTERSPTLAVLLRERGPELYGYAHVLTGDAGAAQALLRGALVRAFRSGRGPRDLTSAHSTVRRAIGRGFLADGRRSLAQPPTVTNAVHAAVLALGPRERACLVLHYLDEVPMEGVAEELGLSIGAAERCLSLAIARLRELLPETDFTEHFIIAVVADGSR